MLNTITELEVQVIRVVDGDTFISDDITFEFLNFKFEVKQPHFRLLGVNTPERGKKGYKAATDFTAVKINGKRIKVEVHGIDVFNRVLCTVLIDGEATLNQQLLDTKLAVVYKKK